MFVRQLIIPFWNIPRIPSVSESSSIDSVTPSPGLSIVDLIIRRVTGKSKEWWEFIQQLKMPQCYNMVEDYLDVATDHKHMHYAYVWVSVCVHAWLHVHTIINSVSVHNYICNLLCFLAIFHPRDVMPHLKSDVITIAQVGFSNLHQISINSLLHCLTVLPSLWMIISWAFEIPRALPNDHQSVKVLSSSLSCLKEIESAK